MATFSENIWDATATRRAIRLLGSHSPRIDDPQSTARALRLVWDIVQRRGIQAEIFQLPGTMPLVVVGRGPILLIAHLDDPNPLAQVDDVGPPSISGDIVTAPGITRKAGVLAALGAMLKDESLAAQATLVVESDRHSGSQSFAYWLDNTEQSFSAAICEVADLPVPAPAIYLAATGVAVIRITLRDNGGDVERTFGGVKPDLGHQLVATLASLKSSDGEVLVPGFYDGVLTPDAEGLAALQGVAPSVSAWLTHGQPQTDDSLSSSHLTLGAFLAPSIVVREVHVEVTGPYLANWASAIVEARVMPGQDANAIARSLADFVIARIPHADVDPILVRPSARGTAIDTGPLGAIAPVMPVAAGNAPAGMLETLGVPTLGFATVWRNPASLSETVALASVTDGSTVIQQLVELAATSIGNDSPR